MLLTCKGDECGVTTKAHIYISTLQSFVKKKKKKGRYQWIFTSHQFGAAAAAAQIAHTAVKHVLSTLNKRPANEKKNISCDILPRSLGSIPKYQYFQFHCLFL